MFKTTTLALAVALMAAPVTFASAQSYFSPFIRDQKRNNRIDLGRVRAERDGVFTPITAIKLECASALLRSMQARIAT